MWFVLAVLSALVFGAAGLFMKASQAQQGNTTYLLFALYIAGTAGFLVNSLLTPPADWFSLPLIGFGLLIGIGSAWGNLIWMKALDYGPASLSSLLSNMNIVLVIILSTWIYNEMIQPWQWLGISLLLLAVALISVRPGEKFDIQEKLWFVLIAVATLLFTVRNGGLKITSEMELTNAAVLLVGYFFSMCWFGISLIRPRQPVVAISAKTGFRWGLLAGLCSYGGLQLYALALERGPANLVAPIFATNSLVIAVGSVLLFRERLTPLQLIAGLCLLGGLVLIRI